MVTVKVNEIDTNTGKYRVDVHENAKRTYVTKSGSLLVGNTGHWFFTYASGFWLEAEND